MHNTTFELNLTVEDESGNEASDVVVVTGDVETPLVDTNLTNIVYQGSAWLLSWTARDPESGLADAHTGTYQSWKVEGLGLSVAPSTFLEKRCSRLP